METPSRSVLPARSIEAGRNAELEAAYGPDGDGITERIRSA